MIPDRGESTPGCRVFRDNPPLSERRRPLQGWETAEITKETSSTSAPPPPCEPCICFREGHMRRSTDRAAIFALTIAVFHALNVSRTQESGFLSSFYLNVSVGAFQKTDRGTTPTSQKRRNAASPAVFRGVSPRVKERDQGLNGEPQWIARDDRSPRDATTTSAEVCGRSGKLFLGWLDLRKCFRGQVNRCT